MNQPKFARKLISGSAYNIIASAITLVLGATRSILLARYIMPEAFGVVALALFFIGLVGRLRDLGLDMAFIHRQETDDRITSVYFSLRVGSEILGAILLLGILPLLTRSYPAMKDLNRVFPFLVMAYFISNISMIEETILRKQFNFKKLVSIDIAGSTVMSIVAPYMAIHGWGIWALVAEQVSGITTRFIFSWGIYHPWKPKIVFSRRILKEFWDYGKHSWTVSNLSFLLDQFDDFWTGTNLGGLALGYYSKAYEFALYPRRVIANSFITVFVPAFAHLQHEREELSRAFYRSSFLLIRAIFLFTGTLALLIPEFVHYVIGDQWVPMILTFRIMLVFTALDSIKTLVENLLYAIGRPKDVRNTLFYRMFFFIPAVILGALFLGINGVALAADGMIIFSCALLYFPLRKVVDFSLTRLMLAPAVALSLALAVSNYFEMACHLSGWLSVFVKTSSFTVIFCLPLLLLERQEYIKGVSWLKDMLLRNPDEKLQ